MRFSVLVCLSAALMGCAGNVRSGRSVQDGPAEPPAAKGTPAAAMTESERDKEQTRRTVRSFGWMSIGLGAAAGAIAVGTSVIMLAASSARSSGCNEAKVCDQDGLDANSDIKNLSGGNAVAWAIAAAGVGVGAILLVTHPIDRKHDASLGIGPSGLRLRGTF